MKNPIEQMMWELEYGWIRDLVFLLLKLVFYGAIFAAVIKYLIS